MEITKPVGGTVCRAEVGITTDLRDRIAYWQGQQPTFKNFKETLNKGSIMGY